MIGDAALVLGFCLQQPLKIAAIYPGRKRPASAVARLGIAGHRVTDLWRNLPPAELRNCTPCAVEDEGGRM